MHTHLYPIAGGGGSCFTPSPSTSSDLVANLEKVALHPEKAIVRKGEVEDCIYFVAVGEVSVRSASGAQAPSGLQGFFRTIKNQRGGGDPSPKIPSPLPRPK